jgi:hypothetical protein
MDSRLPIALAFAAAAFALASCAEVPAADADDVYYEFGLYDANQTPPGESADGSTAAAATSDDASAMVLVLMP